MFFFYEVRKQRSVKAAEYHDTITKHQAAPINIIMHDLIENFFLSLDLACITLFQTFLSALLAVVSERFYNQTTMNFLQTFIVPFPFITRYLGTKPWWSFDLFL